jgi:O-antigen ligase
LVWSLWSGVEPRWAGKIPKKWLLGLGLLLAYPLLQSLPLPASWIAHLSPHLMLWKDLAGSAAQAPSQLFSVSYEPLVSFCSGLWWIFLAGYALLLRKVIREGADFRWFYHTLFWVAGFEAFYGLLQTLIPSLGVLWESAGQGTARGTFVNRNHYATYMGMVWPVLLTYVLSTGSVHQNSHILSYADLDEQKKDRQKRWFLGFLIGLMLLGLVFSQSRGGIAGALISLTVFVVLGKRERKKGFVAFVTCCWVVMLAYGSIIGFHGILMRFNELETDTFGRVKIWEDTWQLIRDHWLMGTGLGTYPEVIRIYQSHLTDQFAVVHAHNDYLELAGDLGAPVAVVMALFSWGYWWVCARRVGRESRIDTVEREVGSGSGEYGDPIIDRRQLEDRRLLALGALAGSAAFLCHSWVEFNWQIPANQLYFIVLLVLMKL